MQLIVHTDGGSRGNPGKAAYGFVFLDENKQPVLDGGKYLGIATNNDAEYQGLSAALDTLLSFQHLDRVDSVVFKLDSNLVVQQVLGNWKIKEERMRGYVAEIRAKLQRLPMTYQILYVPRAENAQADKKVNEILDENA